MISSALINNRIVITHTVQKRHLTFVIELRSLPLIALLLERGSRQAGDLLAKSFAGLKLLQPVDFETLSVSGTHVLLQ